MLPPAPLSATGSAAGAWTGTEMIVMAGGADDAAAYRPATNNWTRLPPFPLGARTDATVVWTGRQLVVIGGRGVNGDGSSVSYQDGAIYDPATNAWTALPGMPAVAVPADVLGTTAAWTGTELLVWVSWERKVPQIGNTGPGGHATSYAGTFVEESGFALTTGATTWRALPSSDVATDGAVAAWTGSVVLVAGGSNLPPGASVPGSLGTGYKSYDPATDSWAVIRGFSTHQWPAVWTGRAFVDTADSSPYRSCFAACPQQLSAYDPASGTWTVLPLAPDAIAGNDSEAVWTGRQLLVWGEPSEQLTAGPTKAN